MSLEKALELNTAAVTRLADLMERFKPNAATSETVTPKAEKPAPKKKAPAKKVAEAPKAEAPKAEAPKAEPVEVKAEPVEVKAEPVEVKEVELVDLQKVARILITAGGDAKTQAKAAITAIAGKDAKIATLDKALYAEVLAALEAVQANMEEV